MTFKTYTITKINNNGSWLRFELNDYVSYENGRYNHIDCKNTYPFNSYRTWSEIEIDDYKTRYEISGHDFTSSDNAIRQHTSNALISTRAGNEAVVSTIQNESSSRLRAFASELSRGDMSGEGMIIQGNKDGEYRAEMIQYDGKYFKYENYRKPR